MWLHIRCTSRGLMLVDQMISRLRKLSRLKELADEAFVFL